MRTLSTPIGSPTIYLYLYHKAWSWRLMPLANTECQFSSEERLGIPEDCVSNSAIAQLTHDVHHMNRLPTACDDSPWWPQNHTQQMQDPFVPFALEAHISHSYQQQMDIFYWIIDITCAIFYLVLNIQCLVECISFDLSANAIKMPGLGNNHCQILMTDLTSSIWCRMLNHLLTWLWGSLGKHRWGPHVWPQLNVTGWWVHCVCRIDVVSPFPSCNYHAAWKHSVPHIQLNLS